MQNDTPSIRSSFSTGKPSEKPLNYGVLAQSRKIKFNQEVQYYRNKLAAKQKEIEQRKREEELKKLQEEHLQKLREKRLKEEQDEYKTKKYFYYNEFHHKVSAEGHPYYFGDFEEARDAWRPHGKGSIFHEKRKIVEGDFVHGDLKRGDLFFSDNTKWSGSVKNFLMTGAGELTLVPLKKKKKKKNLGKKRNSYFSYYSNLSATNSAKNSSLQEDENESSEDDEDEEDGEDEKSLGDNSHQSGNYPSMDQFNSDLLSSSLASESRGSFMSPLQRSISTAPSIGRMSFARSVSVSSSNFQGLPSSRDTRTSFILNAENEISSSKNSFIQRSHSFVEEDDSLDTREEQSELILPPIAGEVIVRDNTIVCRKEELVPGIQIQFFGGSLVPSHLSKGIPTLLRGTLLKHISDWKWIVRLHNEVHPRERKFDLSTVDDLTVLQHLPLILDYNQAEITWKSQLKQQKLLQEEERRKTHFIEQKRPVTTTRNAMRKYDRLVNERLYAT